MLLLRTRAVPFDQKGESFSSSHVPKSGGCGKRESTYLIRRGARPHFHLQLSSCHRDSAVNVHHRPLSSEDIKQVNDY